MNNNVIELGDLERLARSDSPDLAESVIAFLDQSDPVEFLDDDDDYDDEEEGGKEPRPKGLMTVDELMSAVNPNALRYKSREDRKKIAQENWTRFLSQTDPPPPPRFRLPSLLLQIYESGSPQGRAALLVIIQKAKLRYGLWAGLKQIYKRAEARMDAEILGALTHRFEAPGRRYARDVGEGTLIYLRRRAWRYLRQLGAATPELYPQFAVQVLRHYESDSEVRTSWVGNHILAHHVKRGWTGKGFSGKLPDEFSKTRAFDDAWKRSADPLMLLLEMAQADTVARFAITGLRKDFPNELRKITPIWLARLSLRPLASVHEFLVETLQASPEFHQGKLKTLGLHDTVLRLLTSPGQKARTYAIEYARAHVADLPGKFLADLLSCEYKDTITFATSTLKARPPKTLGYELLAQLLCKSETEAFAKKALSETYEPKDLPESFLLDMIFGKDEQREWLDKYLASKYGKGELPPTLWKKVFDDPRAKERSCWEALELATERLEKYKLSDLGATWLLDALTREDDLARTVSRWLEKADSLPGLDVERVKGLVFNARYRQLALSILGNPKLIKPRDLTLPWLLALARRADESMHTFAHRYLLEHWKPADFSDTGDKTQGTTRLFTLAMSKDEPESVRLFAQTYLRCHHPEIGKDQAETKQFQLKPQVARDAYTASRIWLGLWDQRSDVRRFAAAITKAELRAWGYHLRVYELAESEHREVRSICLDATLKAGEQNADLACTLKVEELDAAQVFSMTESRQRASREVAMELIRRHYGRLGGKEKLVWLMQTPDREVRLFAVRLLWEKHRPLQIPKAWRPKVNAPSVLTEHAGDFEEVEALRGFLRRVLYGVPPGRSMEPREDTDVKRRVSASVAKRQVIEVVRDLALEDEEFAQLCAPVLAEFSGSLARGEWQACLSALTQLGKRHPQVALAIGMGTQEGT